MPDPKTSKFRNFYPVDFGRFLSRCRLTGNGQNIPIFTRIGLTAGLIKFHKKPVFFFFFSRTDVLDSLLLRQFIFILQLYRHKIFL